MDGHRWAVRLTVGLVVFGLLGGCASVQSPSPSATPSAAPSGAAASESDLFADLTYRLDLPADWIVLGSSSYDAGLDAAPDVAGWLRQLDLSGPNSFRAYEPLPGAAGLRLAIKPSTTWNSATPGPLQDGSALAALSGVAAGPVGDLVPVGANAKASRFRWTQTLDWGNGSPSTRNCVGYVVMSEFDQVNVVFTYPAKTDRLAEVEAMMDTFVVLGNPVVSLPPGVTPAPTPTPFDKWASVAPTSSTTANHGDPSLEALLPDSIDGRTLTKESRTGEQMGMTDANSILATFGKHPSDLASATATAMPTANQAMLMIGVERLRGVPADQLLVATLKLMPDAKVSLTSRGGHQVTYVMYGAWPVWYYATGDLLYGVVGAEEDVAKVLAVLP